MSSQINVQEFVARARRAQHEFEVLTQAQVDGIVKNIGKYVYDHAKMLAHMACDETGIGVAEDKVIKKIFKSRAIWNSLKDKPSRGIIGEDVEKNLVFVAKPMGVVGAVTPITNPVVTPMCNAMFALKCGNAIIFAAHPKAQKCAEHLTEKFQEIVLAGGGHNDLVQVVRGGSIEITQELMQSVDVVVATGGGAMVKSAYSSGKPSFGVGAGNVPVIMDRGIDNKAAVEKILLGASFDNGIICSHEQFVLAPRESYDEIISLFLATGKVWYTTDEASIDKFRAVLFPGGHLGREVVGKSCTEIGRRVGIEMGAEIRIILLPAKGAGTDDILAKEKLCPVLAILAYDSFEDAVAKAKANLIVEGAGHSAAIHSEDSSHIEYTGLTLPVSRLVVNQTSSTAAGGALNNGFAPTTTLGCGSWGGNSISENLDFKHLMNVSRIGRVITNKSIPTDEEIWA